MDISRVIGLTLTVVMSSLFVGCSGIMVTTPAAPLASVGVVLNGNVFGGQQPIVGATIYLYAAGKEGYGAINANLLTSPVLTGVNGGFNISGKYSCTAGQQMYLVSLGGNPGAGINPTAGLMAALGDCSDLSSSTFISMNEVTTVASVFALAPFMSGYAGVGSSASNTAGMARAFASVNKLANIATGETPGAALPAGAIAPVNEIYTVADILAACVNSTGGVAGDGSICGSLFASATPNGQQAPGDTIGLALAMAQHPTLNVAQQFSYAGPQSPFGPRLLQSPKDWTMSVNYRGFRAPQSTTIDASGNVWVANSGNSTVSVLAQSGAVAMTLSGNGLNAPSAIAIDVNGAAFVSNKGGGSVSAFSSSGTVMGGSPFTVGAGPTALAFDAGGHLWVANGGGNSVSELTGTGATIQTVAAGIMAPTAIAIDPQ